VVIISSNLFISEIATRNKVLEEKDYSTLRRSVVIISSNLFISEIATRNKVLEEKDYSTL